MGQTSQCFELATRFQVLLHSILQKTFLSLLIVISLFGWAVKQAVNVIQVTCVARLLSLRKWLRFNSVCMNVS